MSISQVTRVGGNLRRAVLLRDGAGLSDRQLLNSYVRGQDEAAFAAIVRRHGGMVWSVCRRVLEKHHDAEDAFQATFLVLVRKAASITAPELLANWLYGVAYQTARKTRATTAKRVHREKQVPEFPDAEAKTPTAGEELRPILDEELCFLPKKYRVAIVLCDLEGRTRSQAAQELGCPEGTVAGRLARARAMLGRRLLRRGVVLAGTALVTALSQARSSAGASSMHAANTIQFAKSIASDKGVMPSNVVALSEGVMKAMFISKVKNIAMHVFFLSAVIAAGTMICRNSFATKGSGHAIQVSPDTQAQRESPMRKAPSSGAPKPKIIKPGGAVFRMAWSPGDGTIATVGQTLETIQRVIGGKKRTISRFSSTVKFWDEKGKLKLNMGEEQEVRIESINFSSDGKLAAIGALTGQTGRGDAYEIRIIDPRTGVFKKTIKQADTVRTVIFSPNGKTLAFGGAILPTNLKGPFYRLIQLWNIRQGKVTMKFKQKLQLKADDPYLDGLRNMAFSPDGKLLAAADADSIVRVLDMGNGKLRRALKGHTNVVLSLAFSPDGKTLVTGSFDQTARVWDMENGKELCILQDNNGPINAVAFSPNGKILATGANEVILWDTTSWKPMKTLRSKQGRVSAVAFSPKDGGVLAVAASGQVALWELNKIVQRNNK